MSIDGRFCSLIPGFRSLIPGFGVKLSAIILAGPTVLSAVGACPPHNGVIRRRWWINDGCLTIDTCMGPMPVVAMQPGRQLGFSLA